MDDVLHQQLRGELRQVPENGDADEFLHYKLNRILNTVPREEKMELFKQCHQMIAERKQYVQQKYQRETAA